MFQAYREYKAMKRGLPPADGNVYQELGGEAAGNRQDFEAFGGSGVRIG